MSDLPGMSAAGMARAVRERELSAVELFDQHAALIDELNPELNAIVLPRLGEARAEAEAADRAIASGEHPGPLHGVPFTAKESLDVTGMRTTLGSKLFEDRPPTAGDAVVVRKMRAAGAILLGKTNVSEFLAFYDSVNLVYGATRNPHDGTRSAGGSSGGEAAAVAAGMSPAGLGSDLASSIRQPAHWTGVFGMKPSRGLVSLAGHTPGGTLAVERCAAVGPLARTAEDIELLLRAIASYPIAEAAAPRRAAVYEDDGLQHVSAACREAVRSAVAALSGEGWELTEERPPESAEVRSAYDVLVFSELAAELGPVIRGREDELSDFGRRVADGLERGKPSFDAYRTAAVKLTGLEAIADEWLERHELALCPVAPVTAPELGKGITEIDGEPPRPGGVMTLASYSNALGYPSISVPAGRAEGGLPVGVMVTGRRGYDLQVIAAARELERLLD